MEILQLRSYQQRLIDQSRQDILQHKRVIIYAPQGSGKSVIIAFMALNSGVKKKKTLILTHREEIFKQNIQKMNSVGVEVQLINASTRTLNPDATVYCAMSQTLDSRTKRLQDWKDWMRTIDFVIVDEAHRGEHDNLYEFFREDVYITGLSASIIRSGTMNQLGMFYRHVVKLIYAKELVDSMYLTPSKNYAFQAPKLDDISVSRGTGDYVQDQMQKVFRKPDRYAGIIENYNNICSGTKALVFTTGADHCIDLCIEFNNRGIPAKYLISEKREKTDNLYSGKRKDIIQEFTEGKFKVLVNISILDTGFDCPSIETVILDFSTKSYAKYSQAVGRGSRKFEGKNHFYVLDFGANIKSYGIYEDQPLISLWHKGGGSGIPLTKECPTEKTDPNGRKGCGRLIPISMIDCPFCQFHFQTKDEVYEVELREVIREETEGMMTTQQWCAKMKLQGWSNQRIICAVMIANKDSMKKAFDECIEILRTDKGERISPSYYHFIKKYVLKDKVRKLKSGKDIPDIKLL